MEKVLRGGWGNFISDASLTPRKGRKGIEELWSYGGGGLTHLKKQGNSEELLTRASVSPQAKVAHQRGPTSPSDEPARIQSLAGNSP